MLLAFIANEELLSLAQLAQMASLRQHNIECLARPNILILLYSIMFYDLTRALHSVQYRVMERFIVSLRKKASRFLVDFAYVKTLLNELGCKIGF